MQTTVANVQSIAELIVAARALRERPLLDFIRNVLPKLIALMGNIDIDQIMQIIKIITDLFGSLAPVPAAQSVSAMQVVPSDADIATAVTTVLSEQGPSTKAFDLQKLIELIRMILAIFFPKPAP